MGNQNKGEKDMSKGTFGFGMLVGAVAGYVAATFLAPKPGSETQEEWKQKSMEWKEKAEEYVDKAKDQGMQLKEKVSSSQDGQDSDDITVYSTDNGLSETDALAQGQAFDQSVPGVSPEEESTLDVAADVPNGVTEDARYREADPLNNEPRL